MAETTQRYAVVTGGNKGIGFEICRQLVSNGVVVVLTARDESRGLQAVQKLKDGDSAVSEFIVFHQLDVADGRSISSLADFIATQFGKLDILVNNAGVFGAIIDEDAMKAAGADKWLDTITETYELAEQCLQTNYYGTKQMIKTFLPLLHRSHLPRIVNVSSRVGKLKNVQNEWAVSVSSDVEKLSEEKVEEVVKQYLVDMKEGLWEARGWPRKASAYVISKAAMNAYSRVIAKECPNLCINCVCPGYVKTDINFHTGVRSADEGAEGPVKLALLPLGGPSGCFFDHMEEGCF